jgi:hypothetical protein
VCARRNRRKLREEKEMREGEKGIRRDAEGLQQRNFDLIFKNVFISIKFMF